MNATEGLMRIAMVVRWIGYLLGAVIAIGGVANANRDATFIVVMLGTGAVFAAAGWVLAWIVEGFAKPKT